MVMGWSSGSSFSRVMHIKRGHAVDLRGAGAALAGLAIPAAGEVVGLFRLDLVNGVEHDHALGDFGGVVLELPAAARRRARF